ncbi:MazG-like family protein [Faecalibaculum rodentium]|uniref:MazG-like family protein n=1 Tax=Faecalibaculum rodentium TaxID=1702221 RepID=UPI0023F1A9C1|nr:MazG-like family protein [Faecalibaculum rodentium]
MDSIKQAQEILKQIRDEREWKQFHTPANLAKSICIESAELLECFQWSNDVFDLQDVKEELADVFSYCLLLADTLDLDPMDIVMEKAGKTRKKYPVEKAKGKSTKYDKL